MQKGSEADKEYCDLMNWGHILQKVVWGLHTGTTVCVCVCVCGVSGPGARRMQPVACLVSKSPQNT
jgi:hypothetical protein